jgi:hypothetical protein
MTKYDDDKLHQAHPPQPQASQPHTHGYTEPADRPEVQALIEQLTAGDPTADPLAAGPRKAVNLPSDTDPGGDYKQHVVRAKPTSSRHVALPADKVQINRRNPARVRTTMPASKRGEGVPSLQQDLSLLNVELAGDEIAPSRAEMPTPPAGQRKQGTRADPWPSAPLSQPISSEFGETPPFEAPAEPSQRRFSLPWDEGHTDDASWPKDADEHEVEHESLVPQSRDSGEWEVPMAGRGSTRWLLAAAVGLAAVTSVLFLWRGLAGYGDVAADRAGASGKTVAVPSHTLATAAHEKPAASSVPSPADAPAGAKDVDGEGGSDALNGEEHAIDGEGRLVAPRSPSPPPTLRTPGTPSVTPEITPPTHAGEPPKPPIRKQPFVPGALPTY